MSRSDYERPAHYQIERLYQCRRCRHEQRVSAGLSPSMPCPRCGGWVDRIGESYPASADDWDEYRDAVSGPWRRKDDGYYR